MSIQVLANINNIPFIGKLSVQYGQWDEKKGAKKVNGLRRSEAGAEAEGGVFVHAAPVTWC